jgi:hypothetical protein
LASVAGAGGTAELLEPSERGIGGGGGSDFRPLLESAGELLLP